jgi:hypothetical protein
MEHPSYSSCLTPSLCSQLLKKICEWDEFSVVGGGPVKTTHSLKATSEVEFPKCFQLWQKRIGSCIAAKQNYFKRKTDIIFAKITNFNILTKPFIDLSSHTSYKYKIMFT